MTKIRNQYPDISEMEEWEDDRVFMLDHIKSKMSEELFIEYCRTAISLGERKDPSKITDEYITMMIKEKPKPLSYYLEFLYGELKREKKQRES